MGRHGPLLRDTLADKILRFAIGAFLGALVGWKLAMKWSVVEVPAFICVLSVPMLIFGGLAVVLGNPFVEGFIFRKR